MRIVTNDYRLTSHESLKARQSLAKIRLPELQAQKTLQETKIEGLFLALAETKPNTSARQIIEAGITAAFANRETTMTELRAINA